MSDYDRLASHYHVNRVWTLRRLLWWYVFLMCLNIGLALWNTWWSLFPAIFCFAVCVYAYVLLEREKEIAHTFDQ